MEWLFNEWQFPPLQLAAQALIKKELNHISMIKETIYGINIEAYKTAGCEFHFYPYEYIKNQTILEFFRG